VSSERIRLVRKCSALLFTAVIETNRFQKCLIVEFLLRVRHVCSTFYAPPCTIRAWQFHVQLEPSAACSWAVTVQ